MPRVHWILVQPDSLTPIGKLVKFLNDTHIAHSYLPFGQCNDTSEAQKNEHDVKKTADSADGRRRKSLNQDCAEIPRAQARDYALEFAVRELGKKNPDSVIYFADLNLLYNPRMFTQLARKVRKAGVWRVGEFGRLRLKTKINSLINK